MPKSAHFTEEGSKVLAKQVGGSIRVALKQPAPAAPPVK